MNAGATGRAAIAAEMLRTHDAERCLAVLAPVCRVVVLKGAAIAGTFYAAGARPMLDVDLLVAPREYGAAKRALAAGGYDVVKTVGRPLARRVYRAGAWTSPPPSSLLIDLHASVAPTLRWPADVDGVVARAQPFTLGRTAALRPSLEDMILIAALNDAKDEHAHASRSVEDIARIVDARARGDTAAVLWPTLVSRAREWRATVATWVALERARRCFDARIPDAVVKALEPRRAPVLRRLLDLDAVVPYATQRGRRRRQLIVGPLVTDSIARFAANAAGFAVIRVADAAADRIIRSQGSQGRAE